MQIRQDLNISCEIKWSNTKARRDNGHKAYADLLKSLVDSGNIHLHIRFQKMQDWDHKESGPRRKTDTVSKAFYQLLLHRPVRYYSKLADLYIRADNGDCTELLPNYIRHLNSDGRRKDYCSVDGVKSIQTVDSKKSHPHQLLDVTLGAFAALKNERHLQSDLSKPKRDLAHHIHDLWGNPSLSHSHPVKNRDFNIWVAVPKRNARS